MSVVAICVCYTRVNSPCFQTKADHRPCDRAVGGDSGAAQTEGSALPISVWRSFSRQHTWWEQLQRKENFPHYQGELKLMFPCFILPVIAVLIFHVGFYAKFIVRNNYDLLFCLLTYWNVTVCRNLSTHHNPHPHPPKSTQIKNNTFLYQGVVWMNKRQFVHHLQLSTQMHVHWA